MVESVKEEMIHVRSWKRIGKCEEDLKDIPVEVISHTLSDEKL